MNKLKTLLRKHHLSQAAFAAMAGVNQSTISRVVKNPDHNLLSGNYRKIMDAIQRLNRQEA